MRMLLQTFAVMERGINNFAWAMWTWSCGQRSRAALTSRQHSIQAGRDVALAQLADLNPRIASHTNSRKKKRPALRRAVKVP